VLPYPVLMGEEGRPVRRSWIERKRETGVLGSTQSTSPSEPESNIAVMSDAKFAFENVGFIVTLS
jgi:hypothetical protein